MISAVPTTVQSTQPTPVAASDAPAPQRDGGLRGFLGNLLRSVGAGYDAATNATAVQADTALMVPFEGGLGVTGWLEQKTAKVPVLNKVTGLLDSAAGILLMSQTAGAAAGYRAPGNATVDLTHRAADAIDGGDTAPGWSYGWGARAPKGEQAELSDIGQAFGALGME